jgi:hypothetical protein
MPVGKNKPIAGVELDLVYSKTIRSPSPPESVFNLMGFLSCKVSSQTQSLKFSVQVEIYFKTSPLCSSQACLIFTNLKL